MIPSKSIILKYGNVTCLFNQEVLKYVTVDRKCLMTVDNVLVDYGTQ
jgi:hypothetical protein